VRAAVVTAVLVGLGSTLGFCRDLLLARIFGATAGTDAFLVAWMVPETAAPLLIEGAVAFLLVPLFSRAAGRRGEVRELVTRTLPPIGVALLVVAALVAAGAPWLVGVLAPGLPETELAVRCMRLTAVTAVAFGLAGYLSAALRGHQVFGPPAAIYAAYNLVIVGCVWTLGDRLGVESAALGVAAGGVVMALVQLPAFFRWVGLRGGRSRVRPNASRRRQPNAVRRKPSYSPPPDGPLRAFVPIAAFSLLRQGQVFVERQLASSLPPGSISHLNYAQKIAQVPMMLSLIMATVTFPLLARNIAAGNLRVARRRIAEDLSAAAVIVLGATCVLTVLAPQIVRTLLEHGAFTTADTAATAGIMRVYALGLLGQTVVGVLCRVYFCATRPGWYPAAAMGAGLAVTAALAVLAAPRWGAQGIAAANATGITLTAGLMLAGLRRVAVRLPVRALVRAMARLVPSPVTGMIVCLMPSATRTKEHV
jgi:putative peptidoglycan lipid II flippase